MVLRVGPVRSYLALVLARLATRLGGRSCLTVVLPSDEEAAALQQDLAFFLARADEGEAVFADRPVVVRVPAHDASPYAEMSTDRAAVLGRMAALYQLARRPAGAGSAAGGATPLLVVGSAAALQRKVVPRDVFVASCRSIRVGEEIDREALLALLVAAGYERCDIVDDPGTFAVRGGIVDVYPAIASYPARVELDGDEVESIRLFEPASQRTLRRVDEVEVHPVRELLAHPKAAPRERLLALADELHYPTRSIRALIDRVEADPHFAGIEAFTPAFYERLEPLWSYLEDERWVVVDPPAVFAALRAQQAQLERAYEERVASGQPAFPPGAFICDAAETQSYLDTMRRLDVGSADDEAADAIPSVSAGATDNAELVASLKRARSERGGEIVSVLAERLEAWVSEGLHVLIAAGDAGRAAKLDALLRAHGLDAARPSGGALQALLAGDVLPAGVTLQLGDLSRGFRTDGQLVVISHEEILGRKAVRRSAKMPFGARLGDLRELSDGDHVVHAEHGIGRYRGLVQLLVDAVPADFLLLEYARGDRLYLPVHRLSQVQRYVGADGRAPSVDRLGGQTWQRKKQRAEADVRRFSEELLQLYAQRAALSGHAHPEPDAVYAEFEASFPFNETPDQAQAIANTLEDLTSERPMDRLICGDVGFGKTEVALRAAFLVAMGGRQVAVLAPTTVLVEQHKRSFSERFNGYPLRVESASRFRKTIELRAVIADIAAGKVDVVVGTHRLLSRDVRFKSLGLVVIDEEQRFGVKHKEWLKRMRTQVDVLALTATPIPRTLQLSMVGLREISVIATPPADRRAIRTVTCRYDEGLIREAIRKELARGGQVFFVHNEVQTIGEWAERVAKLVPEARIAVGHGQMDARRLERVMVEFVSGAFDVLVCTTIVESGLDIPRVNTMFVNNAHRYGLSQLYQLRGRIGRSPLRAFCYLIVPGFEQMSDEARARVTLLQQFTELGSGFSVASHDLELRGAGDLLGVRQSGHVAALGFEAYARVLEEAVAELRGEPIVRETDPEINVRLPAFIPDDYVEDTGQRLDLYKRLSDACRDEDAIRQILAEMLDRYGALPAEVQSLGQLMLIKGLAIRLSAAAIEVTPTGLTLALGDDTPLSQADHIKALQQGYAGFALRPPNRLAYRWSAGEASDPLLGAQRRLHDLVALVARA